MEVRIILVMIKIALIFTEQVLSANQLGTWKNINTVFYSKSAKKISRARIWTQTLNTGESEIRGVNQLS